MNKEAWREYNREKQREYRVKFHAFYLIRYKIRHHKEHPEWNFHSKYIRKTQEQLEAEAMKKAKCSFCGMLLASEFHQLYPLKGCLVAQNIIHGKKPAEREEC